MQTNVLDKLGLIALEVQDLTPLHKEQLLALWNAEYPASIQLKSVSDFDAYIASITDVHHILVFDSSEKIQAWFLDFIRNEERYFAMMIYSYWHKKGLGSWLLNAAKQKHDRLVGWVVDSNKFLKRDNTQYASPLHFYLKNGFTLHPEARFESEVLSTVKISWERK